MPRPRNKVCPHPGCTSAFRKSEHLTRHLRSHNKSTPYACSKCGRQFGRQDSVLRHGKLHANQNLPDLAGANPNSICSMTDDLIAAGGIPPQGVESEPTPPSNDISIAPPVFPTMPALSNGNGETGGLHMLADSVFTHQAYMPVASTSASIASPPYTPLDPIYGGLDAGALGGVAGGNEWSDDLFRLLVQGSPISASDLLEWPEAMPTPALSGSSGPAAALPTAMIDIISQPPAQQRDPPAAIPHTSEGPTHALNQTRDFFSNLKTNLFSSLEVSSDFLDTALQLFMMRVNHLLPIVHRPTFSQRTTPPGLLLNMVALGSLFVGSEQARTQGEAIWRVVYKACAASWDIGLREHGGKDQLVLTAATGQLYAMLSSNQQLNVTASCAHSLGLQWGRWASIEKDVNAETTLPLTSDPVALDAAWRRWSRLETRKRAVLAHYILDSQISSFLGTESVVKHPRNTCRIACSDELWDAPTAADWARVMERERSQRAIQPSDAAALTFRELTTILFDEDGEEDEVSVPMLSGLSLYVLLEGILSHVAGIHDSMRHGPAVGDLTALTVSRALLRWRAIFNASPSSTDDRLGLLQRWHCGFCAVLVECVNLRAIVPNLSSVPVLEAALKPQRPAGADPITTPRASRAPSPIDEPFDFVAWSRTPRARRALVHAAAVRTLAERTPFGREALPHALGCVYTAAVVVQASCVGAARAIGGRLGVSEAAFDLGRSADADWEAIGEIGLEDDETTTELLTEPAAAYIAKGGMALADGSPINGNITLYAYTSLLRRAGTIWGLANVRAQAVSSFQTT